MSNLAAYATALRGRGKSCVDDAVVALEPIDGRCVLDESES